jgi:predicted transcriptional regulator
MYIAHDEDISRLSDDQVQAQLAQAEKDLLAARSKYNIRNNIIQQVLIADSILKSVHSSGNATSLERRLCPFINERDTLSMVHATLTSKMQTIHQKIAKLEQENIEMIDSNKQLAQRMLVLANDASAEKIEEVMDARLRKQLQTLEEECVKARREWRVLKSVVAGVIAGSGVDWATNPKLLEVVLDEEDELG